VGCKRRNTPRTKFSGSGDPDPYGIGAYGLILAYLHELQALFYVQGLRQHNLRMPSLYSFLFFQELMSLSNNLKYI